MTNRAADGSRDRVERWRIKHGEILANMLAEGIEQRPERARKESIMAQLHTSYSRVRWIIPITLAISSAAITAAALVALGTGFTDTTAPFVRAALFGIAPALSLLSLVAAIAASRRVLRTPWLPAILGLLAIVIAAGAHMLWYAQLDQVQDAAGTATWMLLIVLAIACASAAIAAALIPSLVHARFSKPLALALGLGVGAVVGTLGVAFLSLPVASISISIAGLVAVVALYRQEKRVHSEAAPASLAP